MSLTRDEATDRATRIWGDRFIRLERCGREPDQWGVATKCAPDGYSYHLLDGNGHADCHSFCSVLEQAAFGQPPAEPGAPRGDTPADWANHLSRVWGAGMARVTWRSDGAVQVAVRGDQRVHVLRSSDGHPTCHHECRVRAAVAYGRPVPPMPDDGWLTKGETCEETTGMVGDTYLRCGRPAVMAVYHKGRREPVYKMCRACGTHNVSNRGAIEVAPVEGSGK